MAEIHLTALTVGSGPQVPAKLWAHLTWRTWGSVGTVPALWLGVGQDTVRIWPADPARIMELAQRLLVLARELEVSKRPSPEGDGFAVGS